MAWSRSSPSRNVALFAHSLTPGRGGISRVARLLARCLAEAGLSEQALSVVLEDSTGDQSLPMRSASDSRLRYVAEAHRAALTHSHFIYDSLGMSRAHPRIPFLRRRACTYIHGLEVWEGAGPYRLRAARRADLLVSNTAFTRERAIEVHGELGEIRVCWLGTETDERPVRHPYGGPPTVTIVGQVYEQRYKGHDALIENWPRILSAVPGVRLLIVGTGPGLLRLREKVAGSSAAAQIEFRGFVPDAQMPAVWAETSILAMPSRGEGFGLVYIEAMRHGVPVIASIHDAAPEINLHGETGYNISLNGGEELVEHLIELIRDPDQGARLGQRGQQRWAEHFTYTAFRRRFTPILTDFLAL